LKGEGVARIAIVEDDYDISHLIREVLGEDGHEIVSYFQPSPDTLQHIKQFRPDLVIIDLRLNASVSGWDIIAALEDGAAGRHIPAIVVSGALDQMRDRQDWMREHGVAALAKPFSLDALRSLVDRMLAEGASAAQA
jgi:DNA-binding response OmpR family regulator